jgi:hypothetical protein
MDSWGHTRSKSCDGELGGGEVNEIGQQVVCTLARSETCVWGADTKQQSPFKLSKTTEPQQCYRGGCKIHNVLQQVAGTSVCSKTWVLDRHKQHTGQHSKHHGGCKVHEMG